jgi:hypothetical protein
MALGIEKGCGGQQTQTLRACDYILPAGGLGTNCGLVCRARQDIREFAAPRLAAGLRLLQNLLHREKKSMHAGA